jgi:hypothetical protein
MGGFITLTKTGSGALQGRIAWDSTVEEAYDRSFVRASLQIKRSNSYTTSGTWKHTLTIGSTTKSFNVFTEVTDSWVTLQTISVYIPHAADGTGACYIYGRVDGPTGTSMEGTYVQGSETVKLKTIPKASTVSASDANIGGNTTITISRASSSFTHTLTYAFGGLSGTIATKTSDTTVSWTVPTSFYAKIPNSPSGECVITCTTYNGSTTVGTNTCVFKAIAEQTACAPSVSVSSSDTNSESTALTGNNKYVINGISNLRVVTSATAKNSASIKSISVHCGGTQKTGADVTFTGAGSAAVCVIVTDSRGYSTRVDDNSLSLISYVAPTIIPTITRDTPTGDVVTVSVRGKWYNGSFGGSSNTIKITVRRKTGDDADYHTMVDVPITTNGNEYSGTVRLSGIDYKKAYSFLLRLDDAIFTDANGYRDAKYAIVSLSKGIPIFDWGEDDFQFNVPVKLPGGTLADYVIEEAYDGDWYYRKWAQGLSEAWYHKSLTPQPFTNKLAEGLYSNDTYVGVTVDIPEGIFNYAPIFTSVNAHSNVAMQSRVSSASLTWVAYGLWTSYSTTPSNLAVQIYVVGRWKQR